MVREGVALPPCVLSEIYEVVHEISERLLGAGKRLRQREGVEVQGSIVELQRICQELHELVVRAGQGRARLRAGR